MGEHDNPNAGGDPGFESGPPAGPQQNGASQDRAPSPPPEFQQQQQQQPQGPAGRRRRGHTEAGLGQSPGQRTPGRARGKAGDIPEAFDPNASGAPKWTSHEAEQIWPEIIQWLTAKGRSPYDVCVNVVRIEPPQRAGIGEPFEAHACMGDGTTTPGAALKFMVEEFYHLRTCRTPARYELQFVWRANGNYITHAYLSLASPAEILALRNAQIERRMYAQAYGQQQAPGLGAPPYRPAFQQPQPQQPQTQQQQPPPYGYPPPYPYFQQPQQPQTDPKVLRRLEELEEENRRLKAGQGIGVRQVHPGTGAPPPAPPPQDLATAIAVALKAVGLGAPAGQTDPMGVVRSGFAMLREFRKFSDEAAGMFEPDDDPEPRQLPMVTAPPEVPDDPYETTEFATPWDDGTKPTLKRDRETGKIDPIATAFANPRPTQRLMNATASLMEAWARSRGFAGPPEEEQAPEQQQVQFQPPIQQHLPPAPPPAQSAPPAAPPTPPQVPPSGGSDDGGWGNF